MSRALIQEGLIALREISRDKVSLRSMSPSRTLNLSTMPSGPDNSPGSRLGGVGGPGAVKIRNKPFQKVFYPFRKKEIKDHIKYAKDRGINPTYTRIRDDRGGRVEIAYPGHSGIGDLDPGEGHRQAISYDLLPVYRR